LFVVQTIDEIIDIFDLSLVLGSSKMLVRVYMLIKVVVLNVANLAVSVVHLGARHRDVVSFVPEHSFSF
jgi:hypothetical protein